MGTHRSGFGDAHLEEHATGFTMRRYEGHVAKEAPPDPHEEWPMSREHTPSVLIVEDDAQMRSRLVEIAERSWKIRALAAADYSTGLALGRAHRPEFGVIDLWIPGGTGIELISALHAEDSSAQFVLITGSGSDDLTCEAMRAGAVFVVGKPFTAQELGTRLFPGESLATHASEMPGPYTIDRLNWEHVHRVFRQTGNV